MRGVPLTHASAFVPFVGFLSEMGIAVDPLLANAGLSAAALSEPDSLIPVHQMCAFLDKAARTEGLDQMGFLVGQRTSFLTLGSLGRRLGCCFSLHEALLTTVRLHPAYASDARLRLVAEGDRLWLQRTQDRRLERERGWQEIEQFNVMLAIQIVRLTSHREWRPREVRLQARRGAGLEKFEALADARIRFEQPYTSIEIPGALLPEPLAVTRCGVLARDKLEQELYRTAPAADFTTSVRQVVGTFLRDGYRSVQQTASAVGMSLRTFQRRLAESDVNYSRIVEEERFRVAAELITQSRLSVTDVAMELGYADSTNFAHAFHRWTGLSPSQYRRHEVGSAHPCPR